MDTMQYVLLGLVIVGITELLTRLRARDYWVSATICAAALVGALFGYFSVEGLDVMTGIALGFGASGALTTIGMIGKKSEPARSKLTA